jgi:hypothetical protein
MDVNKERGFLNIKIPFEAKEYGVKFTEKTPDFTDFLFEIKKRLLKRKKVKEYVDKVIKKKLTPEIFKSFLTKKEIAVIREYHKNKKIRLWRIKGYEKYKTKRKGWFGKGYKTYQAWYNDLKRKVLNRKKFKEWKNSIIRDLNLYNYYPKRIKDLIKLHEVNPELSYYQLFGEKFRLKNEIEYQPFHLLNDDEVVPIYLSKDMIIDDFLLKKLQEIKNREDLDTLWDILKPKEFQYLLTIRLVIRGELKEKVVYPAFLMVGETLSLSLFELNELVKSMLVSKESINGIEFFLLGLKIYNYNRRVKLHAGKITIEDILKEEK